MGFSFNDLDVDLQRSVWAAITILGLILCLALVQILHYILIGGCFLVSGYFAYKMFLEPKIKRSKAKKASGKA